MILVTGATGIVGTRLLFDLLKRGENVLALKRENSDLSFVKRAFEFYGERNGLALFEKINWVVADLLDIDILNAVFQDADKVYHAAALVSYDPRDEEKLIEVNLEGTRNIVNLCIANEVKALCYVSSIASLGKAENGSLINEDSIWDKDSNKSNYGLSKHLAELEVWRGISEGLNAVIINPSIIFGASKTGQSSGMLMQMIQKGSPFYVDGSTGYVDVRDVSRIGIELLEKQIFGERFICSAENVAFKNLLEIGSEVYGGKKPKYKISRFMLKIAALFTVVSSFFTGKPRKITFETAKNSGSHKRFDNSKVKETLGLEFTSVKSSLVYYQGFAQ